MNKPISFYINSISDEFKIFCIIYICTYIRHFPSLITLLFLLWQALSFHVNSSQAPSLADYKSRISVSPWSFTVFIWVLTLPKHTPSLKLPSSFAYPRPLLYQAGYWGHCCPDLPALLWPLPFAAAKNGMCPSQVIHTWPPPPPFQTEWLGKKKMSAKWLVLYSRNLNLSELITTARIQGQ